MQNSKSGRRNISSSKPPASRSMMMLASVTTNRIGRIHAAACTQIYQTYPHQLGSLGFANQVLGQCPVHQLREPSRSEEHTSELQSLMRISYAVFCLQKQKQKK